ncbi:MAG TPA: hypothetical protein VGR89_12035 [Puia sp.]|nr:hypothetical protein [Puia sp.]
MSKLGLAIMLILMAGTAVAQNSSPPYGGSPKPTSGASHYFFLITAEDSQAFYIRLDTEARYCPAGGHLIFAPLPDSNYTITIGFPGQEYPEQRFLLSINKRDYFLKLSRRNGNWGLYDLKGHALASAAGSLATGKRLVGGVKKDDAFSRLMADIVGDTAVMYNDYAGADTGSTASPAAVRISNSSDSTGQSGMPAEVSKLSESKSTGSLRLLYADRSGLNAADTIDVVIPADTQAAVIHTRPGAHFINSDCHALATGYDVDKLKARMLGVSAIDSRIRLAHKVFKIKCFSTDQIRALTEVFPTEAGKLEFLEAAYPFDSDARFPELSALFADPVYAGKFRALTAGH